MKEFRFNRPPDISATLVTLGEDVQLNHAHNLGKILKYQRPVAVAVENLPDSLQEIDTTIDHHDTDTLVAYRDNVADMFRNYLAKEHSIDPMNTNIHFIVSSNTTNNLVRTHWRGVTACLTASNGGVDRHKQLVWEYQPFSLNGNPVKPLNSTEVDDFGDYTETITPFATADLTQPQGDLRAAQVIFSGNPTIGIFTVGSSLSPLNEYGPNHEILDRVLEVTLERQCPIETPAHLEQALHRVESLLAKKDLSPNDKAILMSRFAAIQTQI